MKRQVGALAGGCIEVARDYYARTTDARRLHPIHDGLRRPVGGRWGLGFDVFWWGERGGGHTRGKVGEAGSGVEVGGKGPLRGFVG